MKATSEKQIVAREYASAGRKQPIDEESSVSELLDLLVDVCAGNAPVPGCQKKLEDLLRAARRHGLLGILAGRLSSDALQAQPHLRKFLQWNLQRSFSLANEVLRLVSLAEGEGITCVPFKGAVLSEHVYREVTARQAGDIDLFVRKADVEAMMALLKREGYLPSPEFAGAIASGHLRFDCECELINSSKAMCVDLHWEFTARNVALPLPVDEFFSRLIARTVLGEKIKVFAPEDELIILGVHGAKHFWRNLEWPLTLVRYLDRCGDMDWEEWDRTLVRMRVRNLVHSGLWLAHDRFKAPLPDALRRAVCGNRVAIRLAKRAMAWNRRGLGFVPSPFLGRCFLASARISLREKIRYWFAVVTTPSEEDYARELPHGYDGLYYPLRLIRLLISLGPRKRRLAANR